MKQIQRFNQKDTILVVSAYPPRSSYGINHGIAWYTKKLLTSHAKNFGKRFVVLSERNGDNRSFVDADDKIFVLRVFDRKRKSLYPTILRWLAKFNRISHVHVHSEFATRGISHFVLLIPFLALIRLMGKRITFFSHNVVDDVSLVAYNLGLRSKAQRRLLNLALRLYYRLLGRLVSRVVVLDSTLAKRLRTLMSTTEILVLPMSVSRKRRVAAKTLRKRLEIQPGEKVLLYFGFVTHYKGADWLIRGFDRLSMAGKARGVKLIVAGGPSYSLGDTSHYQRYHRELVAVAKRNDQIIVTGHVSESEVGAYFSMADLVVYPYRGFMGASGSLNHALSYGKPFMVSSKMREMLGKSQGVTFSLDPRGIRTLIRIVRDRSSLARLGSFSKSLALAYDDAILVEHEVVLLYGSSGRTLAGRGQASLAVSYYT